MGAGVAVGTEGHKWIPDSFWTWRSWRGMRAFVRGDRGVCNWRVAIQFPRWEEWGGEQNRGGGGTWRAWFQTVLELRHIEKSEKTTRGQGELPGAPTNVGMGWEGRTGSHRFFGRGCNMSRRGASY